MSSAPKEIFRKLLLKSAYRSRLVLAQVSLFAGTFILLMAALIWWNFQVLLKGSDKNDSLGSTFILIGKNISPESMKDRGQTLFNENELIGLKSIKGVNEVAPVNSNHFPVYAEVGGLMSFATDLPLEAVPDRFLDTLPENWEWKEGQAVLPVILGTQFLDIYNYVFAPGQGLPQLSRGAVKSIGIMLKVGLPGQQRNYLAHIVGFSDRISGVLVPASFLEYGNANFPGNYNDPRPSQLIVKVTDPSADGFVNYLKSHQYSTNSEQLRWNKIRGVVTIVSGSMGGFALLLISIGVVVFIFFVELTIAKAKDSVELLLQLGYSSNDIGGFLWKGLLPKILLVELAAGISITCLQYIGARFFTQTGIDLPNVPGMVIWGVFSAHALILIALLKVSVNNAVK